MREILFRGKRKRTFKGAVEWVYGSLIHVGEYCCILEHDCESYGVTYLDPDLGAIDGEAVPVIPETVGQFTGILDKHDKKIFEGDIILLECPRVHYSVQDRAGGFCLIDAEEGYFDELYMYSNSCEVVGNLYDHGFVYKGEEK